MIWTITLGHISLILSKTFKFTSENVSGRWTFYEKWKWKKQIIKIFSLSHSAGRPESMRTGTNVFYEHPIFKKWLTKKI